MLELPQDLSRAKLVKSRRQIAKGLEAPRDPLIQRATGTHKAGAKRSTMPEPRLQRWPERVGWERPWHEGDMQ